MSIKGFMQNGVLEKYDYNALDNLPIKNYITPQMFGAIGDGIADDTEAFRDALVHISEGNVPLVIPYGTYNLTDILDFDDVTIFGMDPERCILRMTAQQTAREHFIIASNKTHISNIKFQQSYGGSIFGMIECNDSIIENCIFYVEEGVVNNGYFDIYRENKNIKIINCKFLNHSKQEKGGVWVRNSTNMVSKNIIFDKCTFEHMTKDEVVGVWGWNGTVEDVTFRDCTFETFDAEYSSVHMITLGMSGITRNVLMDGCKIYNNHANLYTVKSEVSGDGTIENVKLRNCFIKASGKDEEGGALFGGENSKLIVEECHVVINSNQNPCRAGVFNDCYFDINNGTGGFYYNAKVNHCHINANIANFKAAAANSIFTDCIFDFNNVQNNLLFVQTAIDNDYIRFDRCEFKNYERSTKHFVFNQRTGAVVEFINCREIKGTFYSTVEDFTTTLVGNTLVGVQLNGVGYTRNVFNNFVDGTFIASGLTATS